MKRLLTVSLVTFALTAAGAAMAEDNEEYNAFEKDYNACSESTKAQGNGSPEKVAELLDACMKAKGYENSEAASTPAAGADEAAAEDAGHSAE